MVSGRLYLTSDLTTKDEISLYSTSRFISATTTEASSSAIFQRNSSDAVWSWSKVVEIVDFNPPTLECILSTQRWVSSATNSTRPKLTLDLYASYHPSRAQPKSSHSELQLKLLQLLSLFQVRINHDLAPHFSPLKYLIDLLLSPTKPIHKPINA